eukprot:6199156-Pleurochrysis_carterae.AAC.3
MALTWSRPPVCPSMGPIQQRCFLEQQPSSRLGFLVWQPKRSPLRWFLPRCPSCLWQGYRFVK